MFEEASRVKLRFPLKSRGTVSVEDLWDLDLGSLNTIAKNLNLIIKQQTAEEDFLDETTGASPEDKLRFNIVKHIIGVRKAENAAIKDRREKAQQREMLLSLLEEKQKQELTTLTQEQIKERLKSLES